jgi:hypothetical protein
MLSKATILAIMLTILGCNSPPLPTNETSAAT